MNILPNLTTPREHALQVYVHTLHFGFLQQNLQQHFLDNPHLNADERGTIYDICFGTARHDFVLAKRIDEHLPEPKRLRYQVRIGMRMAAYELIVKERASHGVINTWVEIIKQASTSTLAGVANAVLRKVDLTPFVDDPTIPQKVDEQIAAFGLPAFLIKSFRRALDDPTTVNKAILGMRTPAATWLTVYDQDGEDALTANYETSRRVPPTGFPASFAARVPEFLGNTSIFIDGHVQPQNPASVELIRLATLEGGTILDVASGRGIKAAGFARTGMDVTAVEISPEKIFEAQDNQTRLGVDVRHIQEDATQPIPGLDERFDRVVVDAPCTGTGTLRGKPEIMFRLRKENIAGLAKLQYLILENMAQYVKIGGQLWYAVCSLTYEEGEEVIINFLEAHPEFTLLEFSVSLPHVKADHGTYSLPVDGFDGFFYAGLERTV